MSVVFTLSLALLARAPLPPLTVTAVVRLDLPPFEDAERRYRIEGAGCETLTEGEILLLRRSHERRGLARLAVTQVLPGFALARIAVPGETFPLRGDLAIPQEPVPTLPALPELPSPAPLVEASAVQAAQPAQAAPAVESGFAARSEPVFFLPGETRLSPAGAAKLSSWVQAWGAHRRWSLSCGPWPGESLDLVAARLVVLKEALNRLGVHRLDERVLTELPPGRLPRVYVGADPW